MNTILIFLLFFLPLIVFPFGLSPFETPKVILGFLGMELFIILALFNQNFSFKSFPKSSLVLYLGLFILSLGQLIIYPNSNLFLGSAFRLQGIFLLWHLLLFSLLSSLIKINIAKRLIFLHYLLP